MSVNFTPSMGSIKDMRPFKFWCQKVLPTVYDDSLSYYELLCKVVDYLNDNVDNINLLNDNVTNLYNAYVSLQEYVNNYFDQNFPELVSNKLDEMAEDGTLTALIKAYIDPYIDEQNNNIELLGTQMAQFIADHAGLATDTVLWNGAGSGDEFVFDLSDSPTNYVYIDVHTEFTSLVTGSRVTYKGSICRFNAQDFAEGKCMITIPIVNKNTSDIGVMEMRFTPNESVENRYTLVGCDKVTADVNGFQLEVVTSGIGGISANDPSCGGITKIVGVKNTQNDQEIINARIGANGTVYPTLGTAIRTQVSELDGKINNAISEFAVPTQEAVDNWLSEHPEATTTVVDNSITEPKLVSELRHKLGSKTLYNVNNYGIVADTDDDLYEALQTLIAQTVALTGGVLYFPAGKYVISDTLIVPANTTLLGEGYATEIYYNGSYTSLGCAITNGGNNVTIDSIRVNTPNSDRLTSGGANLGGIGFSTYDYTSLSIMHPSASSLNRRNTANLVAKNIYTNTNYVLQTETNIDYTITNVTYENIHAEKSLVSIMGRALITGAVVKNVVCAVLRLGAFSVNNNKVIADNIYTGRMITTGESNVSNIVISDDYEYDDLPYTYSCIHVKNKLSLSNARITTNSRQYVIERRNSTLLFNNVNVQAQTSTLFTNTETDMLYENYFNNCIFDTAISLIYGYGSNVVANFASRSVLYDKSFREPVIQSGDDLNNYTFHGTYQCTTDAITSSLLNCPATGSFVLQVFNRGSYVNQIIYMGSSIFTRRSAGNGFGSWTQYTGALVQE